MAIVLSAVILVGCLAAFFLTRDAPALTSRQTAHRPGLRDLQLVLRNRPFMLLLIAKTFIVAGTGVSASALAFLVTRVLLQPLSWIGLVVTFSTVGLIASQPLWVSIARRHGKRIGFLAAATVYIFVVLSWLLADAGESQIAVSLRAFLLGIFGGGILLTSQAMLPDVLEHEVKLTGIRHEGAMTGLYTTVERGASAMGVALAGLILSAGGYVGGAEAASPDTIRAIYACVSIVPALMLGASIVAIYRYDLPG
jgi:glycoside/pentoside/hexuronide:cation symporter, GPH family